MEGEEEVEEEGGEEESDVAFMTFSSSSVSSLLFPFSPSSSGFSSPVLPFCFSESTVKDGKKV